MDKLAALKVFCAVIEAGGFAPAADRLGLSTTAVSRHVAQLETQLGIRLLQRTTRRMRPTDEGLAYYERCTQVLHELDEADALVSGTALRPSGRLRITAPIALATLRLAPALAEFARLHPQLELDLVLSDHLVDLTEEGIDIAIRVGRVGNENLVARQIAETEILLAASPEYLQRAGEPKTLDDLSRHACITYSHERQANHWTFCLPDGEERPIRVNSRINANNGTLLAEMAAAGCGITRAPCFILGPLIEAGRLKRVLPELPPQTLPVHAVYPTRRHLSAKVRALTDFLIARSGNRSTQHDNLFVSQVPAPSAQLTGALTPG